MSSALCQREPRQSVGLLEEESHSGVGSITIICREKLQVRRNTVGHSIWPKTCKS